MNKITIPQYAALRQISRQAALKRVSKALANNALPEGVEKIEKFGRTYVLTMGGNN